MTRKRQLLVLWVLAPFVVVIGLWYSIDRAASRPEADELRKRALRPTADPSQYLSTGAQEALASGLGADASGSPWASASQAGEGVSHPTGRVAGTMRRIGIADVQGRPVDLRVWWPEGVNPTSSGAAVGAGEGGGIPVLFVLGGQDALRSDPRPASWTEPVWGLDAAIAERVASGRLGPVVVVGVPTERRQRPPEEVGRWVSERVLRATLVALPGLRRDARGRALVAGDGLLGAAVDAAGRGQFGAVVLLHGALPDGTVASSQGVPDGSQLRVGVIASDAPRAQVVASVRARFERLGAMVFVVPPPGDATGRGAWLAELLSGGMVEVFGAPPSPGVP